MAVALDGETASETKRVFVAVETGGEWGRGQTIVDHLAITGRSANVNLVVAASRQRFLEILHRAVRA
jgi:purine nucleosidase